MHSYLRSVGFSRYKRQKDIDQLLDGFQERYFKLGRGVVDENNELYMELRAPIARHMGVCILGTMREDNSFVRRYYYPYLLSEDVSTTVPVTIHRHVDGLLYSGLADDTRMGVTLIFSLDNALDYIEAERSGQPMGNTVTRLSAFCDEGTVLLPSLKSVNEMAVARMNDSKRDSLMEAARNGDESAMEELTRNDMNTFAQINSRLVSEDVYSIVSSCFMPQGVECDVYQIIGEIRKVTEAVNLFTGEQLYDLTVECNEMTFHVGINKADLYGEPAVGRRFKGRIWMHGRVEYA